MRVLGSILDAARHIDLSWELLIVDNGSTDDTRAVVARYATHLPVRLVSEPQPGISNARNCAVRHAGGRYMIWTDDDVVVDPYWIRRYVDIFRAHPEHALFGGLIVPQFEPPVRSWFASSAPHLGSLLAVRDDFGWQEIAPDRVPYGANFAVRTDVQRQHPFDPGLGVAPGRRRGGEETAVIRAALAAGATGLWVWPAKVTHMITSERQSLHYVFAYYRSVGYDQHVIDINDHMARIGRIWARLLAYGARKAASSVARRVGGRDDWIVPFIDLARSRGTADRIAGKSS